MNYLTKLEYYLPSILKHLNSPDEWDSLVINRRKPYTYRLFSMFGEHRICLHRFDECLDTDSFFHPHPWPGAFIILDGQYSQTIGHSKDLISDPLEVAEFKLKAGSSYEISSPLTWHKITPSVETHTIMLNGQPFENPHKSVRNTKGKDLDKLSEEDKLTHLNKFKVLIERYLHNHE